MEEYLRQLLHASVEEQPVDNPGRIPLMLSGIYEIKAYKIGQKTLYFIHPKVQISLPQLKKQFQKLRSILGADCVLYDDGYTRYGIPKLVEAGIPFIFGENNIYLPNFGIRLHEGPQPHYPDAEVFSPFTQKLILTALYQGWEHVSGKDLAEFFHVSRMTVNRSLIELEALGLPLTVLEGNTRYYNNHLQCEELYRQCEPYLINPVSKEVRMKYIPEKQMLKGGISALAEYSMLGDNAYLTFAVDRGQYRKIQVSQNDILPRRETPACIVQVHRYLIGQNGVIDPISTILSLSAEDREDARVEQSVNAVLEDIFHGKGV